MRAYCPPMHSHVVTWLGRQGTSPLYHDHASACWLRGCVMLVTPPLLSFLREPTTHGVHTCASLHDAQHVCAGEARCNSPTCATATVLRIEEFEPSMVAAMMFDSPVLQRLHGDGGVGGLSHTHGGLQAREPSSTTLQLCCASLRQRRCNLAMCAVVVQRKGTATCIGGTWCCKRRCFRFDAIILG